MPKIYRGIRAARQTFHVVCDQCGTWSAGKYEKGAELMLRKHKKAHPSHNVRIVHKMDLTTRFAHIGPSPEGEL